MAKPNYCTFFDTPEAALLEMQSAEDHRDKHISNFPDEIQSMVGSYYRSDMRPRDPSPENYVLAFISNVLPRLVFNNPRTSCSSATAAIDSKKCIFMQKFLNQWIRNEDLVKVLRPWITQALMLWGVVLTTFDDHPDDESLPPGELKRKLPHAHLLEPHRYFKDPVSTPATKARYQGHTWVRDLEVVKKMKGVDPKVVDYLCADLELQKLQRPNARSGASNSPPRYEIVAYEVWVPECNDYRTDPEGHNGTIYTIACGQSSGPDGTRSRNGKVAYLLPPRPFYGPEWGPYTELGYYEVPGQTYKLSPISAHMQQIEEVNAFATANAQAAMRMKNLVFVDASNDALQSAVQNSPDGTVLGIPNLNKEGVQQVEIGGPSKEQYEYTEGARDRADRNLAISDASRGEPSAHVTATAENRAASTMDVRMSDLKTVTTNAVKQLLNTIAWYGWNSPNVMMFLSGEDAQEMGMKQPVFMGGPSQGEELPPWESAALDIEPYSMEFVDEELMAQQVGEALAIVSELAQMMQEAPWIGYDVILGQLGKLRKFDWLSECINGEMFAEFMKENVQQGIEKHQSEQAMQQAQLEAIQAQSAKTKMETVILAHQASQPAPVNNTGPKPPSVSINYADLPEDEKRLAEEKALGKSSTMPLTSASHIQNALDLTKTGASMQHDMRKLGSQQQHQAQQGKENRLTSLLKGMGGKKPMGGKAKPGAKTLARSK